MGRLLKLVLAGVVVILPVTTVHAQCVDADTDGYFAEPLCGTPPDCNDRDAATHPGAREVCDGHDNDCDGQTDEGAGCPTRCELPIKMGADTRITFDTEPRDTPLRGPSINPTLAWADGEYGLAWVHYGYSDSSIGFSRIDATSRRVGENLTVAIAEQGLGNRALPSLLWTGSAYQLGFNGSSSMIGLLGLDRLGTVRDHAEVLRPFVYTRGLSQVWNGNGTGVSWSGAEDPHGDRSMVGDFLLLNLVNRLVDAREFDSREAQCEDSDSRRCVSMVWTGAGYGVTWQARADDNAEIFFARLDDEGRRSGPVTRLTSSAGSSIRPVIAWNGSDYGVVWQDNRTGLDEIYYVRISAEGEKLTDDMRLTDPPGVGRWPFLVWTGSRFAVFATYSTDIGTGVIGELLDRSGERAVTVFPVTDPPASGERPSAVWTGSGFGVAWSDGRDRFGPEIYFARIGCSRVDIKPESAANRVNPFEHGRLTVAIMGSSSVDVREIDPASLRLGREAARPERVRLSDVNRDGRPDLVGQFRVPEAGIACGDTSVVLSGATRGGSSFEGADAIVTVGCR